MFLFLTSPRLRPQGCFAQKRSFTSKQLGWSDEAVVKVARQSVAAVLLGTLSDLVLLHLPRSFRCGGRPACKGLAEFLFGSEDALLSYDMSEYMEHATVLLRWRTFQDMWAMMRVVVPTSICRRPYSSRLRRLRRHIQIVFNILLLVILTRVAWTDVISP